MTARFIVGDTLTVLRAMPDASVDLVLTSPPFLALRSYLPADHPDKANEMGSEATPGEYLDALLDVVEECRRVLAPHGSLCFELGDTYSGSGGAGGDYNADGFRDGQQKFNGSASRSGWHRLGARAQQTDQPPNYRKDGTSTESGSPKGGDGWPLEKSLCLIPESFRWALVYGRNPFTGRSTPPWRARNVVRWCRPNPPVGALGDKFRPATSDLVVACVSKRRWFDLDAVRTEHSEPIRENVNRPKRQAENGARAMDGGDDRGYVLTTGNPAGAPPLDWWKISTQPFKGSHYATWPEELCRRPILSMCPQRVCTVCGEPSRRIVGEATYERTDTDKVPARLAKNNGQRVAEGANQHTQSNGANTSVVRNAPTLGWTDCGHDAWRPGIVLDPFAGSGTTLAVAVSLGREAIGIDLDERNALLAEQRVGMFLTVEASEYARPSELETAPATGPIRTGVETP